MENHVKGAESDHLDHQQDSTTKASGTFSEENASTSPDKEDHQDEGKQVKSLMDLNESIYNMFDSVKGVSNLPFTKADLKRYLATLVRLGSLKRFKTMVDGEEFDSFIPLPFNCLRVFVSSVRSFDSESAEQTDFLKVSSDVSGVSTYDAEKFINMTYKIAKSLRVKVEDGVKVERKAISLSDLPSHSFWDSRGYVKGSAFDTAPFEVSIPLYEEDAYLPDAKFKNDFIEALRKQVIAKQAGN